MGTNNIDINSFYKVVDLASEGMLRTSQEELASRITEYDEEIKTLCEELDWLKQIRVSKLDSGENLKKLKRKMLYGLVLLVASVLGAFAIPVFSVVLLKLSGVPLMITFAISCILFFGGQIGLQSFIDDVDREIDACSSWSLEEIDYAIRGLEESLQYKRSDRDYVEKVLEYVNQKLDVIDQAIASREFDEQMSTLQNSMSAEVDLEQSDVRQDGLDQEDTKGNDLRRIRTNERKK